MLNDVGIVSCFGDVMICAGEAGRDSCQEASGSPMTANMVSTWVLCHGVTAAPGPVTLESTHKLMDFIASA